MTELAYILAASHSGSTLLAMLLNSHPEVCTVGELKLTALGDVERYRCSCGALIRACSFWRRVGEEMRRRGIPFDVTKAGTDLRAGASRYQRKLLRPLHRGATLERMRDAALLLSPGWRRHLVFHQQRNTALMETVSSLLGGRVIVDSSKVGMRLKYLLRNPTLNVRIIRLIRDGRAVATTYMDPAMYADASHPHLRGGGMGGDRAAERLPMAEAAREWRRSNEEAEQVLAGLDAGRFTQVRYEELCQNPDGELSRLFAFLGVDPARGGRDFRSVEHHMLGNGMRLDDSSEIRLDDRWRSVLTPEHLQVFESVAGAMNRRYGYA